MITNPLIYLFTLASLVAFLYLLEKKTAAKFFSYFPLVVLIYLVAMAFGSFGLFAQTQEIREIYMLTKSNLLPAMLFLMLLQVDFRAFVRLGRSLIIAYFLAVFSIAFAFVVVAFGFSFSLETSGAFGALAGSWMGGTANMIAVGSALGVSEEAFAYALLVDSVNYTLWVMLLLSLVPFAKYFNTFVKSSQTQSSFEGIGCACEMGVPRYWSLILLALCISFVAQVLGATFTIFDATTSTILFASFFGILGSFTRLRLLGGADKIATTMLYLLIALIGSSAKIESFDGAFVYVLAGFLILLLHGLIMVLGAKIFKLDLFSIGIASLANIGGVASAPILAAAYHKNLASVGVLMALMGYIIGTFGGLVVGNILIGIAQ